MLFPWQTLFSDGLICLIFFFKSAISWSQFPPPQCAWFSFWSKWICVMKAFWCYFLKAFFPFKLCGDRVIFWISEAASVKQKSWNSFLACPVVVTCQPEVMVLGLLSSLWGLNEAFAEVQHLTSKGDHSDESVVN